MLNLTGYFNLPVVLNVFVPVSPLCCTAILRVQLL